ncbi:MAG: DNA mismatch repair protein [Sandaracinus sp.]|mgnify:CR=1 FL=1|nr:DNA mismatch repair protein [Sandaracinus sp.]|tara:strand:+ start:509 stop:2269 length:1761 start_codon:yes stop_codon:yes gene_type:complete
MPPRQRTGRSALERRLRLRLAEAATVVDEEPPSDEPRIAREATEADRWLDLIHHVPRITVDPEALRAAVRFAFESGDAGGLLRRSVDQAPLAPSGFARGSFADGLFLPELIKAVFRPKVDGLSMGPSEHHLVSLISAPPDDFRDVTLRQSVLRELVARPDVRAAAEKAYGLLRDLRDHLDDRPMSPGDTARRKIEVLTTLRDFFVTAADGLKGTTSALSRLQEWAQRVCGSPVFGRLEQVLAFEAEMAVVDVRLVLASDGRIRDFQLMRTEEPAANPLVRSPWRRFWSRVVAFFRGYRYGEQEVLLRVVDEVFASLEDDVLPLISVLGDLELYLAALAFRDRCAKDGLEVCLPELVDNPGLEGPSGPAELRGLFNPLLLLQDIVPVTQDLVTEGHDAILLITGPNSGGKTRTLQSVALSQLLAQAGLFVPAREARLTRAPAMFVSLVESAPADQREGRLGTELMRVRRLFEEIQPGSLVILDELCSGTNPGEGIAIFNMVLGLLPRLRPRAFLTTHFLDAARELEANPPTDRLAMRQVELDPNDEPTYQLVPGVAPSSLAHAVASRLGVTHEELEALVEKRIAKSR